MKLVNVFVGFFVALVAMMLVVVFQWLHEHDPIDACQSAVEHDAQTLGYQCCIETCGDAGVRGYRATSREHVCTCGEIQR